MGLTVLSLFDGISCGQIALERAGLKVDKYFASEIKKHAIKVTMEHYPGTIQIGDVRKVHYKDGWLHTENGDYEVGKIDLLIGGSPCQNFSCAHWINPSNTGGLGLEGDKSNLFYEWLRIKGETKPTFFLLENVKMKKDHKQELDSMLKVVGIEINSDLVSFQHRRRVYWTNIPSVLKPLDKHVDFQDYVDTDATRCEEATPNWTKSRMRFWNNGKNTSNGRMQSQNITNATKVNCLTVKQDRCPNSGMIAYRGVARYLTRREMEQAQTLPIGYCDGLSYSQTCDVCGDGWTVDVIAHIFSFIPKEEVDGLD